MFSAFVLGLSAITNKVAFARSRCVFNHREIDCAELGNQLKDFLGVGIGILIAITIFGIWATIFWIMMIIHAANHNIENKVIWIFLMAVTGIFGAVIYYFAVKRKLNNPFSSNNPIMPK